MPVLVLDTPVQPRKNAALMSLEDALIHVQACADMGLVPDREGLKQVLDHVRQLAVDLDSTRQERDVYMGVITQAIAAMKGVR